MWFNCSKSSLFATCRCRFVFPAPKFYAHDYHQRAVVAQLMMVTLLRRQAFIRHQRSCAKRRTCHKLDTLSVFVKYRQSKQRRSTIPFQHDKHTETARCVLQLGQPPQTGDTVHRGSDSRQSHAFMTQWCRHTSQQRDAAWTWPAVVVGS